VEFEYCANERVGAHPLLSFAATGVFTLIGNLEPLLTPVVQDCGVELYDIEFVKESGSRILRLFIDKDGGVDLNDCERVSRAVSAALDEHDPIESAYRLQVGSPGLERRLVKPEHFLRYIGHKIEVRLYAPHPDAIDTGRKKFTGALKSYDAGDMILTDEDGTDWSFEKKQVSACRLVVDL
jgi:ribosome maturation factor RimP